MIDGASEAEWQETAEALEIDLNDFEAHVWPVFRARGYSKDTAVLCFWLNLAVISVQKLQDDEEED